MTDLPRELLSAPYVLSPMRTGCCQHGYSLRQITCGGTCGYKSLFRHALPSLPRSLSKVLVATFIQQDLMRVDEVDQETTSQISDDWAPLHNGHEVPVWNVPSFPPQVMPAFLPFGFPVGLHPRSTVKALPQILVVPGSWTCSRQSPDPASMCPFNVAC